MIFLGHFRKKSKSFTLVYKARQHFYQVHSIDQKGTLLYERRKIHQHGLVEIKLIKEIPGKMHSFVTYCKGAEKK